MYPSNSCNGSGHDSCNPRHRKGHQGCNFNVESDPYCGLMGDERKRTVGPVIVLNKR